MENSTTNDTEDTNLQVIILVMRMYMMWTSNSKKSLIKIFFSNGYQIENQVNVNVASESWIDYMMEKNQKIFSANTHIK